MKSLLFLLSVCCVLLGGCKKDKLAQPDAGCVQKLLDHFDMVPYEDQDINCELFMAQYYYQGKYYYSTASHCVDMVPNLFDCNLVEYCNTPDNTLCDKVFGNTESWRQVGIRLR